MAEHEVSPDADTEDLVAERGVDGIRDVHGSLAIRRPADADCKEGFLRWRRRIPCRQTSLICCTRKMEPSDARRKWHFIG